MRRRRGRCPQAVVLAGPCILLATFSLAWLSSRSCLSGMKEMDEAYWRQPLSHPQDREQDEFCREDFPAEEPDMARFVMQPEGQVVYLYNSSGGVGGGLSSVDEASSNLMAGNGFEDKEVAEIRSALRMSRPTSLDLWWPSPMGAKEGQKPDSRFRPPLYVDIGANIGSRALRIASDGNARVIAFEGMSSNVHRLLNSVCANHLTGRLMLFPFGLAETSRVCPIYSKDSNQGGGVLACDSSEEERLQGEGYVSRGSFVTQRLDRVLDEDIHMLAIDVQGMEDGVFAGCTELFQRRRIHHILIQIWDGAPDAYIDQLAFSGYAASIRGFTGPWISKEELRAVVRAKKRVGAYFKAPSESWIAGAKGP